MHEVLWKVAFGVFLAGVPLGVAYAIVRGSLGGGGRAAPRWLRGFSAGLTALLAGGFAALTASIIARWAALGYPPFSNLGESLTWMAWGLCGVYFVSRLFRSYAGMEVALSLGVVALLALSTASFVASDPRPLMPALQSNWLVFHVLTCMVSYGAFFAAFLMALLWLLVWRRRGSARSVDALVHQTITFGFLLLTVGIASGAVWARQAWGRYWGWDPKETWSLITWLVYGIYLHFRLVSSSFGVSRARRPAVTAVFAIVGFAFVILTYFGVSFLLPSLHSYASG
jgi:ABC-type transport system involved in cytochrome c biogenesis permease subunit